MNSWKEKPIVVGLQLLLVGALFSVFESLELTEMPLAFGATHSAQKLLREVEQRPVGKDSFGQFGMVISSSSGKAKNRSFHWWRMETKDGDRDLIKFSEPSQMKETGLLIHSFDKGPDSLWLFLSRAKKKEPRRISGADRGNQFLGSDFSYVDFEVLKEADFHAKSSSMKPSSAVVQEYKTQAIEIKPKDKEHPYEKLVLWVDQKSFVPVLVHSFIAGELVKTLEVLDMKTIDGIVTVMQARMTRVKKKSNTLIKTKQVKYNVGLPESFFTVKQLSSDLIK